LLPSILISNDDGYRSPGLRALADAMAELGEVWVVAPEQEQSATSRSISIHRPLRIRDLGQRWYAVDGTPTDCSYLGVHHLMRERRPALMVSGINHGANLADDVTYSGTVAAAMEAVTLGVPGIAISFNGSDLETLFSYRDLLEKLVRRITLVERFPADTLLNINLPNVPAADVRGIQVTRLGSRFFKESLTRMKDPWGHEIYWIGGGTTHWTGGEDSDHHAVAAGYISVTPLHMDLTNYSLIETVRGWSLEG
jgi:5'-nucleotidase